MNWRQSFEVSQLQNGLNVAIARIDQQIAARTEELQKLKTFYDQKGALLIQNGAEIETFLRSQGFEIQDVKRISKTGYNNNKIEEGDQLRVDGLLRMVGRMIPSTNDDRNDRVVGTIRQAFLAQFAGMSMSINQFSLDHKENIIFEVWVL